MGFPPASFAGLGGDSIPVQSPAVTAPFVPGAGADPSAQVNDKTKQLLQIIAQVAQRKQMANTAVPGAVPGMTDPAAARNIGMNTENPNAWGSQRFAAGIQTNIKNAVAKQKQEQLLKAEGDWSYLQSSLNELYQAQQSGDQQAVAAAQRKVDVITQDPKKLKNMAKALNQDWLNPEKTTVYAEALKNVAARGQQQDAAKGQARQGIMGIFKKLIGQRQQPQLTPEQTAAMGKEIQAKAPTQTAGADKDAIKILEEQMKEEARAKQEESKEAARAKEQETKFAQEKETLEMKEKFTRLRDASQNQFHETMERLRENSAEQRQNAHDLMMMKALGMKLDAQQEKLFKPDPTKLNKEVTDSVTTLRQQLAQANSALKSIRTSASNHWLMGPGKEEISNAEDQVKTLEKAISHIEKNRDAIVKGKAELGDVVGKAYDIMGGGAGDEAPPPPVPGAVVTKK